MPLFDGAGMIGCGDDEPDPVVLGGVAVRLAVVGCEESLLAVLLLLFKVAKISALTKSAAFASFLEKLRKTSYFADCEGFIFETTNFRFLSCG